MRRACDTADVFGARLECKIAQAAGALVLTLTCLRELMGGAEQLAHAAVRMVDTGLYLRLLALIDLIFRALREPALQANREAMRIAEAAR